MAGGVKGITIEFRGETTKLDKAMRQVNKSTREIDNELRKVNNNLKFNPTSVDLWRMKQDLLKKKITETEDKLKLLKEQQAHMDASGVDKNSLEYQKLQREIMETESKLKTFKTQLQQIGNVRIKAVSEQFKEVGDKMKEVGDKMKSIGTSLTTHLTVPIMALGGLAIKAFKDVDTGLDIVAEKTGAVGKELMGLQQIVKDIAGEVPSDFETIGTAVGETATRFQLSGDELESLSTQFLKFAKINGTDVETSIDQTQKALAAFGLDATHASELLDQLNVVGQQTGVDMNTLLSGLVQNGTAFQELGLSAEQAAVLMGQMETSGANSETVMQGLRKALKNATEDGIPLNEALANLQDTIVNGKDGVDGLTASYDLFGKSGDQIYGAVKNGTLDFSDLASAATNAGDSVNQTFENTLDPADRFKIAMQNLQVTGYEVGAVLLETLAPAIEQLSTFIQGLAEKWNSLSPQMQQAILIGAGILAILGPIVTVIGTLVTVIGGIITAVGAVLPLIALLFSPVGIVIGLIAALIAIMVLLVKHWDTIQATVARVWANVKKTVMGAVGPIITKIQEFITNAVKKFNEFRDGAKDAFEKARDFIINPIKKAKETVEGIIKKIKDFFPIKIGKIMSSIKLPHFKWHSKEILGKIKIPVFDGIDWYASGGIFDSPSVIGVGEAGPEAVVPLDKLWDKLDNITGETNIVININGTDKDKREIAEEVKRVLIEETNRRRLAWQ